jgi:hypothetical protein
MNNERLAEYKKLISLAQEALRARELLLSICVKIEDLEPDGLMPGHPARNVWWRTATSLNDAISAFSIYDAQAIKDHIEQLKGVKE